jgi:signal transduction histidine kinase
LSTPLRVLFIEDSEDDVLLLVRQLRLGGYAPFFERVETADALRAALHRGGWEIIISDYSMPRFYGLEALAVTLQINPDIPFLLISGTVGEEVAVESIKAGAADYLMKQNLIRFVPAVTRALRDSAERKAMLRAELVLREQRALLSMIYDNTSDSFILCTWDMQQGIWLVSSVNRSSVQTLERIGIPMKESDLIGITVEQLNEQILAPYGAESRESMLSNFYKTAETGKSYTQDLRLQIADEAYYFEVTYIPFFGRDGFTRYNLIISRDVTVRRRAEDEHRFFESQLAQSRKLEALGQLAGGVAHDFNNILTGILGFADVIQKSSDKPQLSEYANEIIQAGRRAQDLVKQIKMFSRRQPSERKPLLLSGIVHEALGLLRHSAPSTVRIEEVILEKGRMVVGDETQLHQVVMNLGTNAIHAMEGKSGTILISVEHVEIDADFARIHPPLQMGEYLRLRMADPGLGMQQGVVDRLFEPFFTTKPPGVGTGLGLSVVHGVVQSHEGAIIIETVPGEGTVFDIYLPALKKKSMQAEPVAETPMSSTEKRILFVDDEPAIVRLAQVMLTSFGYEVTSFDIAARGLEAVKEEPQKFDLLVTDLTMPEMTGVDLARAIRTIRPDIPILLTSGYADEVPEETLQELGIGPVLAKPFQMQSLKEAVQSVLKGN